MLPVEVILRQRGYDPGATNDGVVIPLVRGKDFWVNEENPLHASHCGNCPVASDAYNTALLFKELRKLALQHLHDTLGLGKFHSIFYQLICCETFLLFIKINYVEFNFFYI